MFSPPSPFALLSILILCHLLAPAAGQPLVCTPANTLVVELAVSFDRSFCTAHAQSPGGPAAEAQRLFDSAAGIMSPLCVRPLLVDLAPSCAVSPDPYATLADPGVTPARVLFTVLAAWRRQPSNTHRDAIVHFTTRTTAAWFPGAACSRIAGAAVINSASNAVGDLVAAVADLAAVSPDVVAVLRAPRRVPLTAGQVARARAAISASAPCVNAAPPVCGRCSMDCRMGRCVALPGAPTAAPPAGSTTAAVGSGFASSSTTTSTPFSPFTSSTSSLSRGPDSSTISPSVINTTTTTTTTVPNTTTTISNITSTTFTIMNTTSTTITSTTATSTFPSAVPTSSPTTITTTTSTTAPQRTTATLPSAPQLCRLDPDGLEVMKCANASRRLTVPGAGSMQLELTVSARGIIGTLRGIGGTRFTTENYGIFLNDSTRLLPDPWMNMPPQRIFPRSVHRITKPVRQALREQRLWNNAAWGTTLRAYLWFRVRACSGGRCAVVTSSVSAPVSCVERCDGELRPMVIRRFACPVRGECGLCPICYATLPPSTGTTAPPSIFSTTSVSGRPSMARCIVNFAKREALACKRQTVFPMPKVLGSIVRLEHHIDDGKVRLIVVMNRRPGFNSSALFDHAFVLDKEHIFDDANLRQATTLHRPNSEWFFDAPLAQAEVPASVDNCCALIAVARFSVSSCGPLGCEKKNFIHRMKVSCAKDCPGLRVPLYMSRSQRCAKCPDVARIPV